MKRFLEKLTGRPETNGAPMEGAGRAIQKGPKENTDPNNIKILIVSDNHMKTDGLEKVLAHHAEETDYFFHCGDSNLEHHHGLMQPFVTVKGNTDFKQKYQHDEEVKLVNDERVWITHGHKFDVGRGVDGLLACAKRNQIHPAIILYGHTHMVDVQLIDGFLIINPGSIALPRDGIRQTYAKLVVTPVAYHVTIFDVKDHSVIREFQFQK